MRRAPITLLIALMAALGAAPAGAVLPPEVYRAARMEARYHVQVAVESVAQPARSPGPCTVSGRVVRLFRGAAGELAFGTPVRFEVSCRRPGDEIPAGPVLWTDAEALARARYLEVYLNGAAPGDLSVARWQSLIIPGPTTEPQCPAEAPGLTCW